MRDIITIRPDGTASRTGCVSINHCHLTNSMNYLKEWSGEDRNAVPETISVTLNLTLKAELVNELVGALPAAQASALTAALLPNTAGRPQFPTLTPEKMVQHIESRPVALNDLPKEFAAYQDKLKVYNRTAVALNEEIPALRKEHQHTLLCRMNAFLDDALAQYNATLSV